MPEDHDRWQRVYDVAVSSGSALAGTYHLNYIVEAGADLVVVRVSRANAANDVEPRMFAEADVLAALAPVEVPVPALLHRSPEPRFLVLSFVPGGRVLDAHPFGSGVPEVYVQTVCDLMAALYEVDEHHLQPVLGTSPWPTTTDGTPSDFLAGLLSVLSTVYGHATPRERELMDSLGIPADPFAADAFDVDGHGRRLRLCHGDLGRENALITSDGHVHVIDWELAVWGDPVWDIASHMHRVAYPPAQARPVQERLLDTCPEWTGSAAEQDEYHAYLKVEQYRSLVLDCLRLARAAPDLDTADLDVQALNYHRKLVAAGLSEVSQSRVIALFRTAGNTVSPH